MFVPVALCCVCIPAVYVCVRLRSVAASCACIAFCFHMALNGITAAKRARVKNPLFCSFPLCLFCHSVAMVSCWLLLCISFLPLSGYHSDRDRFSLLVFKIAPPCSFLSLYVLIGPGLPLPTDAAPPTTAQCILPAAPRDCPRTSLSLFPHSSLLVRKARGGNRCRRQRGSLKRNRCCLRRKVNFFLLESGKFDSLVIAIYVKDRGIEAKEEGHTLKPLLEISQVSILAPNPSTYPF